MSVWEGSMEQLPAEIGSIGTEVITDELIRARLESLEAQFDNFLDRSGQKTGTDTSPLQESLNDVAREADNVLPTPVHLGLSALRGTTNKNANNWRDYANCHGADPNLFYPESSDKDYEKHKAEAQKFCKGCVVREECLDYALDNGEHFGIWGGETERQRRTARRRRASITNSSLGASLKV